MVVQTLLTPEEAAVYLGVRQNQLAALPSLPVVMLNRNEHRYRVLDLDRWVLSRRFMRTAARAA